ncbi:MAG: DUF1156 domain-containing protein [Candidatus Dormibacteraeota bacterium]|uniref:DUF1156 domain-containing protein n=1 Tax=Candidatus Amunia macphersoniae TaxID=3127014 RepID=A0A934NDV7_9BACT|nr:DUF1156 domain-containing protein [Candidatus Dormibacteraeota bacterium]
MSSRRKLIEVAIPLEAINAEAAREKSIRHGHPSTMHLWWARRPLAACRAVLFAQLVDDPSSYPERFTTPEAQAAERQRLFRLIEQLVLWENSNNEQILSAARAEIQRSLGDHLPPVLDPFAGGGSIPLEAQRLGLEAHASDLNPVAVLITKALVELPAYFAGRPPIHPNANAGVLDVRPWGGAQGLAEDVRHYGAWMRQEAQGRIGHLYPDATLPDGDHATVIAWLWARNVVCPNPACGSVMPLIRSFALAKKKGKETWLRPVVEGKRVRFDIASSQDGSLDGTILRTGAVCLVCHSPVPLPHIRLEGKAGRIGSQLIAIVAEGKRGRTFLPADEAHERAADVPRPEDVPTTEIPYNPRYLTAPNYGMTHHADLFTNRQLIALTTFSDLVMDARERVVADGGDETYADAVSTYLALGVSRLSDIQNSLCRWENTKTQVRNLFSRQAIQMIWDFGECGLFSKSAGDFAVSLGTLSEVLRNLPARSEAHVSQADAATTAISSQHYAVCTDPPYYDNVGYADLSDFFYVWLRRSIQRLYPTLFSTVLTPKAAELVADPYRSGGDQKAAERAFEEGFERVFRLLAPEMSADIPMTVFYAFKQAEDSSDHGLASTGWETMLEGLLRSGFAITGTWPIRTELSNRMRGQASNALASSIVLVCRPRAVDAGITDRKGFLAALQSSLPRALRELQEGNVAPVDLAQAAIGPGMAVFSRYAKVVESDGSLMRVRTALGLINQALDEVLAEQEGEFDPDTRWAIAWFEQHGFTPGRYGDAETLSKAKVTSVDRLAEIGIVHSRAGVVRLLRWDELDGEWDRGDVQASVWALAQHLIRTLDADGEEVAADLLARASGLAEPARDLAYRLFVSSERRGWAADALAFNSLVTSWPEITRLAAARPTVGVQETML